ncbi:2-C-methyl-D-erythritol 4-phosphate cytidylyltransferase [Snodgrassella alvi]|jgi:2-C-methyl-D-erythritol 4-phosphate cytidylyltransferase|uniref:2-C-methyl-D-erythritol 4-phosphate cytidylyltransferase n=1 Tax=Snodgrassella alvi TaxID=1196083 RepID=A0A2N9Y0J0_9NEIS|nr:2-C-methyl-D-erythritol 4-phosphate cytidylyltransferase [Snodgrassella alvi]PIT58283.1 2-C-methyl-D-erythritol 4-phosphate cytidylyltransferase [Snodgrassella alvi]
MTRHVVLIPAAGIGARFGAACPKQYVNLAGKTVLEHTVSRLAQISAIDLLLIVVSELDEYIDAIYPAAALPPNVHILRCGGATRAQTVRNGITYAQQQFGLQDNDWLLVHDAARCCVSADSVQRLLAAVHNHTVGGLLALPVADTLKQADAAQHVCCTVSRAGLWQAQTPQMFRAGILARALTQADLDVITDESSAVEALGLAPLLIPGDVCNLKLTSAQDALLATYFLQQETVE